MCRISQDMGRAEGTTREGEVMKLRELKKAIDYCASKAETTDPDVLFYFGKKTLEVVEIGQFGVVPDVVITLKAESQERGKHE